MWSVVAVLGTGTRLHGNTWQKAGTAKGTRWTPNCRWHEGRLVAIFPEFSMPVFTSLALPSLQSLDPTIQSGLRQTTTFHFSRRWRPQTKLLRVLFSNAIVTLGYGKKWDQKSELCPLMGLPKIILGYDARIFPQLPIHSKAKKLAEPHLSQVKSKLGVSHGPKAIHHKGQDLLMMWTSNV